jgi:ABC-type transporter Mla subunit MlaD
VSLTVVAACCGGKSESAQETWANDVCSPLVTWKNEITKVTDQVTSALKAPSADTGSTLKASVTEAQQATTTLVSDLKAVGPPPGDNGQKAQDVINGLTKSLQSTLTSVQNAVQGLQGANLSQAITTLGTISTQVSGAVAQAQSAADSIGTAASDLKDGFENADSCKELRSN